MVKDVFDILKDKSHISGVTDQEEKVTFSTFIRQAYIDLQKSFTGNPKVIIDIISRVPDIKIIFLPNEDNVKDYKKDSASKYIINGVTYAKSEAIIVAAKDYKDNQKYRRFLGTIIHEFCHFAIFEVFGSFKPYFNSDDGAAMQEWSALIKHCRQSCPKRFPIIKDIFDYPKLNWVDELAVRIPEFYVRHEGDHNTLQQFEEHFTSLNNVYLCYVHQHFDSEAEKVASLRMVNEKTLLGNKNSELHDVNEISAPELNFTLSRYIIKTYQTKLVMKIIYKNFYKMDNFMSTYMFIDVNFLAVDENVQQIRKSLECKKQSTLVIDGAFNFFVGRRVVQQNLCELFKMPGTGKIVLILHETQNFEFVKENEVQRIHDDAEASNTQIFNLRANSDEISEKKTHLNNEADSNRELNKYEKCIKLLDRALKIDSNTHSAKVQDAMSFNIWGIALSNQKRFSEAIVKYQAAQELCTDDMNDKKKKYLNNEADLHYDLKNYDTCIEILKNALKTVSYSDDANIENERSFMLWGNSLYKKSNFSEAIVQYQIGQDLCGENMNDKIKTYLNNEAECYLKLNKYDTCIELIEKALKIESNSKDTNIEKAEKAKSLEIWGATLQKQNKFSEAILKYQDALRLCTDIENMHGKKKMYLNKEADLNYNLKDYDTCINLVQKALRIDSNCDDACIENENSWNLWGAALHDKKQHSQAIIKYTEAKRVCTENVIVKKKNQLNNEAESNYELKIFDKCIELVKEALNIYFDSDDANIQDARSMNLWGLTLFSQKKFSETICKFQHAEQLCTKYSNDERKRYLNNGAESYRRMEEHDKCIKLLSRALFIVSDSDDANFENARSLNMWGRALDSQKDFKTAIINYQNAIKLCTKDMSDKEKMYLRNEATSYRELNDYEKCYDLLHRALTNSSTNEENVQDAYTLDTWGLTLDSQGKFSEAIEKYQEAQRRCPDEMINQKKFFFKNEAKSYRKLEKYDKCIELLDEALKIDPDFKYAKDMRTKVLSEFRISKLFEKPDTRQHVKYLARYLNQIVIVVFLLIAGCYLKRFYVVLR